MPTKATLKSSTYIKQASEVYDLILTAENELGFKLPIFKSIYDFKGPLYHIQNDLPHPGALINNSWSAFRNSVEKFFLAYEEYNIASKLSLSKNRPYTPQKANDPSVENVITAYRTVLYVATELIENLTNNLKISFLPKDRYNEWRPNTIKRWREHPTVACNKLKHNHNILAWIEASYTFGLVRGYCVCQYMGDSLRVNTVIHPKKNPFAFGTDLRRICVHIYLIANAVNEQLHVLYPDAFEALDTYPDNDETEFLRSICEFMPLTLHHYQNTSEMPIFKMQANQLLIADTGGSLLHRGAGSISTIFSGDGYTKSFPIL